MAKASYPETRPKDIDREVETLRSRQTEINKNVGKFVLIQGETVDFFPSYKDALHAGYERFGLENFLVRQVKSHDVPIRAMRVGLVRMGSGPYHLARRK